MHGRFQHAQADPLRICERDVALHCCCRGVGRRSQRGVGRPAGSPPDIIDVNVHLFDWPFRKLKYGQTRALLAKLRKHRIVQA
jgi:hypothetical protein